MNKKLIALALIILAVLSALTACTNNTQTETTPATTASASTSDADALTLEKQFEILARHETTFKHRNFDNSSTPNAFFFAVTDLDNDGILDVITSACLGSGLFTESSFFEVNEKGHGINSCNPAEINRNSEPDLIVDSTPCYVNDATGERFFVFTDVLRASASEIVETTGWYTFRDNRLVYETIATKTISGDTTTYKSTDDEAITEEDFTNAAANYFKEGYTLKTATFGWTPFVTDNGVNTSDLPKEEIEKIIIASYEDFSVEDRLSTPN